MVKQVGKELDSAESRSLTLETQRLEIEISILKKVMEQETKKENRIEKLASDLTGGRKVTDFRFDQIYSKKIRELSRIHWSPVEVAIRAAELLVMNSKTRVLDVGSGCGKFCTVGALTSPGQFIGVEQRAYLIEEARRVAEKLKPARISFIHGNMADLDWEFFDAFYLYNPFYEHQAKAIRIDNEISYNKDKFNRYVGFVESKLRTVKRGARVVTYHGFGGILPDEFECIRKEPYGTSVLELWVKTDSNNAPLRILMKDLVKASGL